MGRGADQLPAAGHRGPAGRRGGRPRLGPGRASDAIEATASGRPAPTRRSASSAVGRRRGSRAGRSTSPTARRAERRGGGARAAASRREPRERLRRGRGRLPRATRGMRAGTKIEIEGLGARFGGTYALRRRRTSSAARTGYTTHFVVSGRAPRTLVDLMTPAPAKSWGNSVVIGMVTQNDDPDEHRPRARQVSRRSATTSRAGGRGSPPGRRQGPRPADDARRSATRSSSPSSTATCARPYVLGSLWNGQDKPGDARPDGRLVRAPERQAGQRAAEGRSSRSRATRT